jgi:hypothetical protein
MALQRYAQTVFNMTLDLVFRSQGDESAIKACFPKLSKLDLNRGNIPEYDLRVQQLQQLSKLLMWGQRKGEEGGENDDDHTISTVLNIFHQQLNFRHVYKTLSTLRNITQRWRDLDIDSYYYDDVDHETNHTHKQRQVDGLNWNLFHPNNTRHGNISLPFLKVTGDYVLVNEFADLYYDDFRVWFAFNHSACCQQVPDPDESVFVRWIFVQMPCLLGCLAFLQYDACSHIIIIFLFLALPQFPG